MKELTKSISSSLVRTLPDWMLFIDMRLYILLLLLPVQLIAQRQTVLEGNAQGTYYIVKYIAADTVSYQAGIDSIFASIDNSLSLYKPGSLINRFNREGKVKMDVHMQAVIKKALAISELTGGAFDITVKPLVDAWGFGVQQPKERKVPGDDTLRQILNYVGYQHLRIKGNELSRAMKEVTIDCNGIAQGYTSDQIGHYLSSKGIKNYLVDVGGELCSSGKNTSLQYWTVGVEAPVGSDIRIVSLVDQAITTSGNYRRFFDEGSTRFAHTIDPVSGQAVHNNIISVTVIAPDAMTADGIDNALILMGVESAFTFIRQHPELHVHAGFIYKDADGVVQQRFSPDFPQ